MNVDIMFSMHTSIVTHVCVADNLQPVRVKDSTETLTQLIKLVKLFRRSVVPQHAV